MVCIFLVGLADKIIIRLSGLQSSQATFLRCCIAIGSLHILCLRTDEAICLFPFRQTTLQMMFSFFRKQAKIVYYLLDATVSHLLFLLQSTFHSMTQLLGVFLESHLGHHSRSLNMRVSLPKWSNFWQLDPNRVFSGGKLTS